MPLRPIAVGMAFVLVLAAADRSFAQDDRERARAEFQRGVDAYQRQDYAAALEAFQEAYRLAPHPNVRVNIANCYEQLDRPLEALFHFEHFLAEAERPPARQRREVEAAIRRLEQQVGRIQLQVTPDGALVTIDGTEQRRAPVTEPVRVTAARHTVEIQMEGYQPERQVVDVQGGQTVRVAVRLRRAEAVASTSVAPSTSGGAAAGVGTAPVAAAGEQLGGEAREPASRVGAGAVAVGEVDGASSEEHPSEAPGPVALASSSGAATSHEATRPSEPASGGGGGLVIAVPTIVAGAVTIAAAIGAGITGGLALKANSDFEWYVEGANDPSLPPDEREQARRDGEATASQARTLAAVTDALLVTAIVGAGATVFFLITTQEGGMLDDGPRAASRGPTVGLVPIVGDGVAGALAVGTF